MPAPGHWPSERKLLRMFHAGLTYDEIAEAVERASRIDGVPGSGFRPTRSGVARKFERLGFPPRNTAHTDLVPWRGCIRPEHASSRWVHMLRAESKKRAGKPLKDFELSQVSLLHDLLFGRGAHLVVGYHPQVGFYTTDATDDDEDIVRVPSAEEMESWREDRYAADISPEARRVHAREAMHLQAGKALRAGEAS